MLFFPQGLVLCIGKRPRSGQAPEGRYVHNPQQAPARARSWGTEPQSNCAWRAPLLRLFLRCLPPWGIELMIVITLPLLWRCLSIALAKANARPLEPRERGGTRVRCARGKRLLAGITGILGMREIGMRGILAIKGKTWHASGRDEREAGDSRAALSHRYFGKDGRASAKKRATAMGGMCVCASVVPEENASWLG